MANGMKIGDLAGRVGVSAKTVRYYESLGLLAAPTRTAAGYRLYGPVDVERLRFVVGAKALGLSLAEIQEIVAVWQGGERPCGHVAQLLAQKLGDLDRRIADMTRLRNDLALYMDRVAALPATEDAPCAHIQGVAEGQWAGPEDSGARPTLPRHGEP